MHLHGIYVGHWAGNLGDSAVFDAFDSRLPASVSLTLEVETVAAWRARPQTDFVSWQDAPAVARSRERCDAVLLLGTTVVTDLHAGEWPIAPIVNSLQEAVHGKRPVHAIGVGVYPTEGESGSDRFRRGFAHAVDCFSVRDRASYETLLRAGVPTERLVLGADLAWLLKREADDGAARERMRQLVGEASAVAVNAVHEDWRGDDPFYESVACDLDAFSSQHGTTTLFLCNEVRPGEYFDGEASRRLQSLMKTPSVLCPPGWMHPEEMIGLLRQCRLAVSMRYHFAVFAAMAGIPWCGFHRGGKMAALLAEFGQTPVSSMGAPPRGRLMSQMAEALNSWDRVSREQERRVDALARRAATGLEFHARRLGILLERGVPEPGSDASGRR